VLLRRVHIGEYSYVIYKNGDVLYGFNNMNVPANTMFVSGNDVHLVGRQNRGRGTILWKNGITQVLTELDSEVNSVYVCGADVYVAGLIWNDRSGFATIWKNGESEALTDGIKFANATSVFVSGSDVYVSGYEGDWNNRVAKLWKNGILQNITEVTSNAEAHSVFVVE